MREKYAFIILRKYSLITHKLGTPSKNEIMQPKTRKFDTNANIMWRAFKTKSFKKKFVPKHCTAKKRSEQWL